MTTSTQVQAELEDLVERELLGPWDGPGEELPGASLHAKALVIDRTTAFVGSANITGSALERNLECGLLVRGGDVAGRIWNHVMSLRDIGALSPDS